MKYIRTEDGVFEIVGFDNECIIPSPIIKMNRKLTHCSDYKNCKQADTIEKLCDEFCYIKDGVVSQYLTIDFKYKRDDEFCALRNKLTANGIAEISKGISKYELQVGELKGAIWTNKGLIYVAKENDKGELELIWSQKLITYITN